LDLLQENTFVIIPLYSPSRSLGVIIVDNFITGKPITSDDISSLEIFASQASLAIEHSHLYKDMLQKIDELELVSQELEHSKDLLVEAENIRQSAICRRNSPMPFVIQSHQSVYCPSSCQKELKNPYTINFSIS